MDEKLELDKRGTSDRSLGSKFIFRRRDLGCIVVVIFPEVILDCRFRVGIESLVRKRRDDCVIIQLFSPQLNGSKDLWRIEFRRENGGKLRQNLKILLHREFLQLKFVIWQLLIYYLLVAISSLHFAQHHSIISKRPVFRIPFPRTGIIQKTKTEKQTSRLTKF